MSCAASCSGKLRGAIGDCGKGCLSSNIERESRPISFERRKVECAEGRLYPEAERGFTAPKCSRPQHLSLQPLRCTGAKLILRRPSQVRARLEVGCFGRG